MSIGFVCPACSHDGTQVKDSRPRTEGGIRRRRRCPACAYRFTTWEVEIGEAADALSLGPRAKSSVMKQVQEMVAGFGDLGADDRAVIISLIRRLTGSGVGVSSRLDRVRDEAAA